MIFCSVLLAQSKSDSLQKARIKEMRAEYEEQGRTFKFTKEDESRERSEVRGQWSLIIKVERDRLASRCVSVT